jgi:hypothetical protein
LGIRHFALSPQENFLAMVDWNGSVIIYSLSKETVSSSFSSKSIVFQGSCIVSKELVQDNFNTNVKSFWLSDNALVVPSTGSSTVLISTDDGSDWKEQYLLPPSTFASSAEIDENNFKQDDLNLLEAFGDAKSGSLTHFISADKYGKLVLWQIDSEDFLQSTPIKKIDIDLESNEHIYDVSVVLPTAGSREMLIVTGKRWQKLADFLPEMKKSTASEAHAGKLQKKSKQPTLEDDVEEDDKMLTEDAEDIFDSPSPEKTANINDNDEIDDEAFLSIDLDNFTQPQTKPTETEDDISDDMLLDIDLDAFTQAATQPNVAATQSAVYEAPSMEAHDMLIEVPSTAAEPVEEEIPADKNEKPLKRLSKANNNTNDDDDEEMLFEDDKPTANKAKESLGSLLAAPASSSTVTTGKKVDVKSLFKDEADEDNALDLASDNSDDEKDSVVPEEDEDELALAAMMEGADGATAGGAGGASSAYTVGEILKLKKQLKTREFLTDIPFHPVVHSSSTHPDDKGRRYLVWNEIGNITLREDITENRIEIRFTDTEHIKMRILSIDKVILWQH